MREPSVIAARTGEVIGDSPDRRVEILCDHDTMHATWSRFGPRRDGADLHVHRHHDDLFYVLRGELTVRLGEHGDVVVRPGTLARVPPLVVHGFRNGGDEELRYLNVHAPGVGFADYMRALRDGRTPSFDQEPPPPDGTAPATDAVVGGEEILLEQPGVRVALLADIDAVGISETWAEPGGPPVAAHVHRDHAESFYVLEGEISVTTGGRELRAGAGAWLTLPPGVAHSVAPASSAPVRFLNLHAPACGFGAFVRALAGAGGDSVLAAARAPFDEHPVT